MTTAQPPDQQATAPPPPGQQDAREASGIIIRLLGTGIPVVTIASTLAYVLGRTYLHRYYGEFGIPASALSFSTTEYLFASTDTFFASIVAAILVWAAYRSNFNFFELFRGLMTRIWRKEMMYLDLIHFVWLSTYIRSRITRRRAWVLPFLLLFLLKGFRLVYKGILALYIYVWFPLFIATTGLMVGILPFTPIFPRITGLAGLLIGLAMGMHVVLILGVLNLFGIQQRARLVALAFLAVFIVAGLPFLSSQLASAEAFAVNMSAKLPVAVIETIKDKELPAVVQEEEHSSRIVQLRIGVINSGSVYGIVQLEGCTDGRAAKACQRTVVISVSAIKSLCYLGHSLPAAGSKPCG